MALRLRLAILAVLGMGLALCPLPVSAFDSIGHNVIEALAYRALLEGHGDQPARPEVLRDLINDGALMPPVCFGRPDANECKDAAVANPLLEWPMPRTSWPDLNFRRQFSDEGQCFHFMATLSDEASAPIAGTRIPRQLAIRAVVRCRDLLDRLVDTVVMIGGRDTRESGLGLYELMHSVQDSFSFAHTQREAGTRKIQFLRVWEPVGTLAGGRIGAAYSGSPTRHAADEPRDRAYVRNFTEVEGRPCKDLVNYPYTVPFECLSEEGEAARQALVDLLVVVHDLRLAQKAHASAATLPSKAPTWLAFKARWFDAAYACSGSECDAKQPAVRMPSSNLRIGIEGTFSPSAETYGASLRGMLLQYSPELNPFVYSLGARLGYERDYGESRNLAVLGLDIDLLLPVGHTGLFGLTPLQLSARIGPHQVDSQIGSQLLTLYWQPARDLWLGLRGPVEFSWTHARAGWAFGLALGLSPSMHEVAPGQLIRSSEQHGERHDDNWSPQSLWYGSRIKGRVASIYLLLASAPHTQPDNAEAGTVYGAGALGVAAMWERDRWGGRYPSAWGASLLIGGRSTSGSAKYLTAAAALEWRWYLLKIVGLSVVPARVEYGLRVEDRNYDDPSWDVYGTSPHQFYFQAGSRLGAALNAGLFDILIQAPTLAWRSKPFHGSEILTFQIGIKLD
jgi:hypothetical protein